ncbi:ABC transporter ATP-binding protein [Desulfobacterium sp. N47]
MKNHNLPSDSFSGLKPQPSDLSPPESQASNLRSHPSDFSLLKSHPSDFSPLESQVSGLTPHTSNDVLVRVENVSKKFCRSLKRSLWYGMKDLGSELIGRSHKENEGLRQDEFWAVKDVSFELKRGECLGLIGRNGAGKTTLLRMLNGLIKPDKGRIEMRGRVGALIALGAGFNPILTGRENIYVNAAVLGLSQKEINSKFDEIVEFAELGEFIDTPVQSYSSGMTVRLGFAVAITLEPDVLILDEVLAVGDMKFQSKCFQRMKDIMHGGGAILLVTHALEQVAYYCDRAILVNKGRLLIDGDTSETLNHYIKILKHESRATINDKSKELCGIGAAEEKFQLYPFYNPYETRWGDRDATMTDVCLIQNGQNCLDKLSPGVEIELIITACFHTDIHKPIYGLSIKSPQGNTIFNINSRQLLGPSGVPGQKKGDRLKIRFTFTPFLDVGDYLISLGIASEAESGIQPHDRRYDSIRLRMAYPLLSTGEMFLNPSICITA